MNDKRLRACARRHSAGRPPLTCSHTQAARPCDAARLAVEVGRLRAWADFASDLLDAHLFGFAPGDWQAADALAHTTDGSDWPPAWSRDPDDAAHIIVAETLWPTPGRPAQTRSGQVLTAAHFDWLADVAERGFDLATWRIGRAAEEP